MIKFQDVSKTFKMPRKKQKKADMKHSGNTIRAVNEISFSCKPGRIFTLLGPNGAGKTTALRMIATLLKPTSGSIEVAGFDTREKSREVRKRIGFLSGTTKLYERLTPNELVKYYADLHHMDSQLFKERKNRLFDLLDMHAFVDQRIGKLSSGMKQKVSIVRTIIHDPDVLVFDEPTTGLDVLTAKNIIELLRNCREEGKTIIFSTHIMGEVSLLSDDLAIIHQGKLCYNETFKSFQKQQKTRSLEDEFIRILEAV